MRAALAYERSLLVRLRKMNLSIAESYPYASRIGGWLRLQNPEWALDFAVEQREAAALPLAQARDYAFLFYCENTHKEHLDDLLVTKFFPTAPAYLRQEFENTVKWYAREYASKAIIKY